MNEIILFKGQYEIIRMSEYREKADNLYEFINTYFSKRGFQYRTVETNSKKSVNEYITEETICLAGHSNGSKRILKELDFKRFHNIKAIIFFDADLSLLDMKAGIEIPIIIFLSKNWQSQNNPVVKQMYKFDDDHYFSNSFEKIEEILNESLDSTC